MIRTFRIILIIFYIIAGTNHFINPELYIGLIPSYLPFPEVINYVSGSLEILFAVGVIFEKTRLMAVQAIIALLILFIPSHIYFIQVGSCVETAFCVAPWIAWLRLLLIHPLLIIWAWSIRKS